MHGPACDSIQGGLTTCCKIASVAAAPFTNIPEDLKLTFQNAHAFITHARS